ncbi:MAG: plasmid pRiA4b ORF-3 family protein [Gemmataceae bacterium]
MQTVGKGTQNIDVTHDEIDYLIGEIESAACSAPNPHKKRLQAVLQKLSELSSMERVGILEKKTPKSRKRPLKKTDLLYQFKITLLDVKPAIWRRIQVPDCNLNDLHEYIQAAFGWWNSHMHQFEIAGRTYSQPSPFGDDFGMEFRDETDVLLSTLIPKSGGRFRWIYEYDFGDGWRHEIVFEGFPAADPKAKVPLCLEGKRACPPEDCGGPWGYADYLAIMANPKHRDYKEMLEWNGPFDPEAFDVKKATTAMRKIKTSSR